METELDSFGGTWRFERLSINASDEIEVVLTHAAPSAVSTFVDVSGKAIGPVREVLDTGIRATVRFEHAWIVHAITESLAIPIPSEKGDRGVIRILAASPYLEFLRSFVWFDHPMNSGASLYRVITEDRVVDVFSTKPLRVTVDRSSTNPSDV